MAKIFLDTNILVCAFDKRNLQKQARAHQLVRSMIVQKSGVISTQILQEFAYVVKTKFHHPIEAITQELSVLESLEVVQITPKLIRQGLELLNRFQLTYWDAMLLAAAQDAHCDQLFSEDFLPGPVYDTVRVVNPLLDTPL